MIRSVRGEVLAVHLDHAVIEVGGVGLAVRTLGNPGLAAEFGLERHFRDIQAVLVHAPQEDTALTLLGRSTFARFKTARDAETVTPLRQVV